MNNLTEIGNTRKAGYSYGIATKKVTNRSQLTDEQFKDVITLVLGNAQFHSQIDEEGWGKITEADVEKYLTSVFATRHEFVIVAIDVKKVCGVIVGGWHRRFNVKHVNIYDLFVSKDYRKMGVGKQLLDTTTNEKIDGKPLVVELGVYKVNENAVSLYESWGMKPIVDQCKRMQRVIE